MRPGLISSMVSILILIEVKFLALLENLVQENQRLVWLQWDFAGMGVKLLTVA